MVFEGSGNAMKSISSMPGPELRRSMRRTRVTLAMLIALVVLSAPTSRIFNGRRGEVKVKVEVEVEI